MTMRMQATVRQFVPFAMLSGLGWCIDAALLMTMAGPFGVSAALANVLSSLTAAGFVYAVAHSQVYAAPTAKTGRSTAIYLLYTLVVIAVASWAIGMLAPASGVLLAKVLVTPPQLLLNFIVSRALVRGPRP